MLAGLVSARHVVALRHALGSLGLASSSVQQVMVVPVEVAELVSLRSAGTVQVPDDVQEALGRAASETNRKAVRQQAGLLSDRLKRMARSRHRGGVQPNFRDLDQVEERPPAHRGKRRHKERVTLEGLARLGDMAVEIGATPDMDAYWGQGAGKAAGAARPAADSARGGISPAAPAYDQAAALAYAATRLPACYAALSRVFREARLRLPGWAPATMLDFGAGPGTAAWAAQRAWGSGGARLEVTAVERSPAMAWLGQEIEQGWAGRAREAAEQAAAGGAGEEGEEEAGPAAAAVPPPRVRWAQRLPAPQQRLAAPPRQYDVVVAAYALGELGGEAERRRVVDALWQRTGRVLVLVETGTPAGAAFIQHARTQLLRQGAAAGGPAAGGAGAGAHVLAPCPHDGRCPLEGRQSWCHFVQRYERTGLQRLALTGGGRGSRPYGDERFSYVVMARGGRPSAPEQVEISPRPAPAPGDAVGGRRYPHLAHSGGVVEAPSDWEGEEEEEGAETAEAAESGSGSEEWSGSEEEGSGEEEEGAEWSDPEAAAFFADASDSEAEGGGGGGADVMSFLPGEGFLALSDEAKRAILDSMAAEVEAGADKDSGGGEAGATAQAALAAAALGPLDPSLAPGPRQEVLEAGDPRAEHAAAVASGAWSRVIRPPRKRSGHVVLDICSATGGGGGGAAGAAAASGGGTLLRQVVSKSAAQARFGGPAAYKLARRLRWGDVWPSFFQRRLKAVEPPAAE